MFLYKSKLPIGFKFRHYFSIGEQFVIDSSKQTSEDRFGKITNFVEVANKVEKEEDVDLNGTLTEINGKSLKKRRNNYQPLLKHQQRCNISKFLPKIIHLFSKIKLFTLENIKEIALREKIFTKITF